MDKHIQLANDILKLHTPDPQVMVEIAREQQETIKGLIEKIQKRQLEIIAAQESEAGWKTEADKSDQRRIDAESELAACHAQSHGMDKHIQMTKENLHEILRQTWNREISADDAFELLEDTIAEVERFKGIANSCHAQSHGMSRRVVEAELKLEAAESRLAAAELLLQRGHDGWEKAGAEIEWLKGLVDRYRNFAPPTKPNQKAEAGINRLRHLLIEASGRIETLTNK